MFSDYNFGAFMGSPTIMPPRKVNTHHISASAKNQTLASVAQCNISQLSTKGGRQGENGGANVIVEIANTGSKACKLENPSTFEILRGIDDKLLAHSTNAINFDNTFILKHGQSKSVILYWSNWCQTNPGNVNIAIRFPTGTVIGPLNGPPGYNYVPTCINQTQSSVLQLVG